MGTKSVRVYVLKNRNHPILIDTGSHLHQSKIMEKLDRVLEGASPEVIFLTHTELPHSGNLRAIVNKWPKSIPVVSNTIVPYIELAPIVELERIVLAPIASTQEFAGRRFEFVNAPLKDQPASQWIFDFETGTLFTADAFGYYHADGKCDLFPTEEGGAIESEGFREYHELAFRYLRWVIPELLNEGLTRSFKEM